MGLEARSRIPFANTALTQAGPCLYVSIVCLTTTYRLLTAAVYPQRKSEIQNVTSEALYDIG